jgi:hypothetical protein
LVRTGRWLIVIPLPPGGDRLALGNGSFKVADGVLKLAAVGVKLPLRNGV